MIPNINKPTDTTNIVLETHCFPKSLFNIIVGMID